MNFSVSKIGITALLFVTLLGNAVAITKEEYVLFDLNGKEYRIADAKGKWIVMNFWATWCAPCIHEMPELQSFYRKNQNTATVWGVTFEESSVDRILEFVEKLEVTYPILGHGGDPVNPYGKIRVLPTTFLIDPNGEFYQRIEGPVTAAQISAAIRSADIQIEN